MAISFEQIPASRREPGVYIEIDPSLAVRGLQGMPHRALILGQKLSGGAAAVATPVLITDPEQAATAFGRGSMLHAMCVAFRRANTATELWAVACADGSGAVAAIKSVTISKISGGSDFAAGTLSLWVGGRPIRVGVSAADEPADVAARIVAAATDPMLPATLAVDGVDATQVNITARHAGAAGSLIDVRVNRNADETLPGNLAVAIATETAGATDPTIAAALTAVEGEWWTEIVTPWLDSVNYGLLAGFLADRFDAMDARDGVGFAVLTGTVSALVTGAASRNSPHVTVLPHQNSPTPTWEAAAAYAGVAAFQTQIDPARQLRTLPLPGVLAPHVSDRFTPDEMDALLNNGVSSTRVIGGEVRLWRCVTTYTTSPAGADDPAFLDLTTLTLLAFLRWSETQRILLRFPRHKLANDGTRFGPGQAIVTPEIMRGELIALYAEWEEAGLVENSDLFKELLIVERDGGDPNRLNSLQTPDLINNFRVFAARIQFRL